jgi:hypothetical protein
MQDHISSSLWHFCLLKQSYQIPQIWVKYRFGRFDQIRVLPWVKYGFVTVVGGKIENRVKYGFVTVRDLLLVRAIRGVRGIRKLPWPLFWWYRYFSINFWSVIFIRYKILFGGCLQLYHIFFIGITISILYHFYGSFWALLDRFPPKDFDFFCLLCSPLCALILNFLDFEKVFFFRILCNLCTFFLVLLLK